MLLRQWSLLEGALKSSLQVAGITCQEALKALLSWQASPKFTMDDTVALHFTFALYQCTK